MGVFGEKHTSLTREQKRQLIHQADTHKLRPTEVCDWVQATWGLRIARVTVYSILHKQRASLMAGHKDLYQTMQNGINSLSGTKDATAVDLCLDRNKETGRVNKYRASPNKSKNKSKDSGNNNGMDIASKLSKKNTDDNNNKRSRSSSVVSDRSYSSAASVPYSDGNGEVGARWEGQLKRVREPASVELDRAMVQFLKSPDSVDSQGRRLNDAELQSHALRLAQSIPSAKRMRCSFGWLRHFKRRLGVQWAADNLGRHRWIIEMDRDQEQPSTTTTEGETQQESDQGRLVSSTLSKTRDDEDVDIDGVADDIDEKYHSSQEFATTSSSRKRSKTRPLLGSILGHDNSLQSVSQAQSSQQQHSPQSILASYPNLFGSLPPLHISGTNGSMDTISPLATTLDPKLTSTTLSSAATAAPSAFGMSVDGKMRKVPTKEEAYEMLQSLLMYYEQDHFYTGEQQTLLLPRWIHQQRQIVQQTQETDARMMWIHQQQQQQTPIIPYSSFGSHVMSATEPLHPYHRYHSSFSSVSSSSTASLSPPALSPISTLSPLSPMTPDSPLMSPFNLGFTGAMDMGTAAGLSGHLVSGKSDPLFSTSSPMTSFDHQQILGGHPFSLASFQH
ncbi:hypothetical protein BG011_004494 [Mortierella polycephala]|uniref:HTH CENPB-type domain-containing protein n=1 Tax=Mortierella polycephala TaxID=41804 RepID=A0A9P6U272_9FUNG|nr:hypothetical protein BG011_004494 [Mortierella polycephala]